jgi:hypothetical protein
MITLVLVKNVFETDPGTTATTCLEGEVLKGLHGMGERHDT